MQSNLCRVHTAFQRGVLEQEARSVGRVDIADALNHSTVDGMKWSRGCMYSTGAWRATTSASRSFAAIA